MKFLVTGATGGLGRNAVDYLLRAGHEVRATGRNTTNGKELAKQGAEFVPFDLVEGEPAQLVSGVDAVWHCAALSSPWGPYAEFHKANVLATNALVRAAGRAGVARFVHVSTPSLYFDYQHHHLVSETYRPRRLVNHYAATKAEAERCIRMATDLFPDMKTAILRPRGIFGKYDQALIPRIERVLRERDGRLPLPNGGKALVDLTYAENVVHAMSCATVVEDYQSGTAFNITNDEPTTVADVLNELFARRLGRKFSVKRVPYFVMAAAARALEAIASRTGKEPLLTRYSAGALAFDMTLDISRARVLLNYRPLVSMADGVARTADWMRSNG
jgi:nucleoside-diphosphate-sugar epimerase